MRLLAVLLFLSAATAGDLTGIAPVPSSSGLPWLRPAPPPSLPFPPTSVPEPPERFVPGQVVVRFKADMDEPSIVALCARLGYDVLTKGRFLRFHLLGTPEDSDPLAVSAELNGRPEVDFAEPNYRAHLLYTPNDPYYWTHQWNLQRTGALDMQLAWDLTKGSASVVVAVIDAGIAYEDYQIPAHEIGEVYSPDGLYHRAPDLAANLFVPGYDFVKSDEHPNDEHRHGTHVAGTIAQCTGNNLGCAGMAPQCRVMPLRVADQNGHIELTWAAEAVAYAREHGADVINMSLGWPDSSHLLHEAIVEATNAGVVVVAAAGNDNRRGISYPAAFSECISVGAVDWYWQRCPYSNYGPGLDVVAPGGDVRTQNYWPIYQQTYEDESPPVDVSRFDIVPLQGTSMASPHVAGLAALMKSRGISSPAEIKQRMYRSAFDLGTAGWDEEYGNGLIEPVGALGGQSSWLYYDNADPDRYYYVSNGSVRCAAVYFTPDLASPFDVTEGFVLVSDEGGRYDFQLSVNPSAAGVPDLTTNLAGPTTFTTVGDNSTAYWYDWDFSLRRTSPAGYFMVFRWVPPNYGPPFVGGDTLNISQRSFYHNSTGWVRTTSVDFYLRTLLLKDTLSVGISEENAPRARIWPTDLVRVYPQPAARDITVDYSLADNSRIQVSVVNSAGRYVASIEDAPSGPGRHSLTWSRRDAQNQPVPNGVYFLQLRTADQMHTARFVLSD